jgi:hypothetical protein
MEGIKGEFWRGKTEAADFPAKLNQAVFTLQFGNFITFWA